MNIKNDYLKVTIDLVGAEVKGIYNLETQREVMWSGDPSWWNRVSPVLFPFVGRVKDKTYTYNQKPYLMESQHGFLRDREFTVEKENEDSVWLVYTSTQKDYAIYPFEFTVRIGYELSWNKLSVHWHVVNRDDKEMIYSIGAHPGFLVHEHDSRIVFNTKETNVNRYILEGPFVKEVYREEPVARAIESKLFENDAIIYDNIESVTLFNDKTTEIIKVSFPNFRYVGVWSPLIDGKMAPFVCIEPWLGIADFVDGDGRLENKVGVNRLHSQGTDRHTYTIEIF